MMSTLEADLDQSNEISLITKGAPDVLLARCDAEYAAGEMIPLSDARRQEILSAVESLADDALRTLAVAYRPLQDREMETEAEHLEHDEVFLGLVGIIDPPRDEVRDAIAEAQTAGIRIYMITGDHPNTAARIGADLGIHEPGSRVVSGGEIERLSEPDLRQSLREASIFARVSPEHKLRIIDALQADGNIVAMTGDGVNDAPALKSADIGVAMGITGTDVSKEAADMILADDNFATIITAVREGRGIFANIRKFMHFLLSSNIGEVLTMFFGVMFASRLGLDAGGASLAVPLLATQILWINLLTDTGPALAMGVDPAPDDVMAARPRKMTDRVIDREMWINITLIGAVMATVSLSALDMTLPGGVWEGSGTIEEARTMAFTTLVFAQLFNTFNSRAPRASAFHHLFTNHWLWGAIALSTALQIAVVHIPVMNTAFTTSPLDAGQWGLAIGLASLVLVAGEVIKVLRRVVVR
jgi:magnesium-transporting ATPase (P-type)